MNIIIGFKQAEVRGSRKGRVRKDYKDHQTNVEHSIIQRVRETVFHLELEQTKQWRIAQGSRRTLLTTCQGRILHLECSSYTISIERTKVHVPDLLLRNTRMYSMAIEKRYFSAASSRRTVLI